MGTYLSTPNPAISGQPFSLSITTFNEYFIYSNYILTIDSIDYTTYTTNNNGNGTTTITFTNIIINGTGNYPFILKGQNVPLTPIIMLEGSLNINPICYLKGTKILCMIDGIEQYICIENIIPGTLIKTYNHGYKKLKILGWNKFRNNSKVDDDVNKISKLYKLSKDKNPDLIEDLFVSGQHSILVDELDKSEIELTKTRWKKLQKIDNKYLLMAFVSTDFEVINDDNEYELFQVILENEENNKQQFGIWANGILSESMSYYTFMKKKRLFDYQSKKTN